MGYVILGGVIIFVTAAMYAALVHEARKGDPDAGHGQCPYCDKHLPGAADGCICTADCYSPRCPWPQHAADLAVLGDEHLFRRAFGQLHAEVTGEDRDA
jgi:hypothetical protein